MIELDPPSTLPRGWMICRLFNSGFRLGLVQPVDLGIVEQLAVAERNVDPDMPVMAAGFDEQHAMVAGFGKPVGEHAAG